MKLYLAVRKPPSAPSSAASRRHTYRLSARGRKYEKIRVRDRADRRNPRDWRDMRGRTVRNRRWHLVMAVGGSHFDFFRPFSGDKTTEVTVQGRLQRGIEKAESAQAKCLRNLVKLKKRKKLDIVLHWNQVINYVKILYKYLNYILRYACKSVKIYRKNIRLTKIFVGFDKKVRKFYFPLI